MNYLMSLSSALVVLVHLCAFGLAQTTMSTATSSSSKSAPSGTSTSSSAASTWTVQVGNGGNFYSPDVVQANVGDIIEFDFFPPNHSVVRAEYLKPCIPYEDEDPGKQGFFSGFHQVDAVLENPPKWTLRINDTNPVFYYCSAPGSCIDYQMVGVINPSANTSLELQKQAAKDSSYMLQPGEPFPAEGSSPTSSASSTTSTSSTPATVTATPSQTTAAAASTGLGGGAVAGIAIGCAAVALLAAGLLFFVGRTRRLKKEMQRQRLSGIDTSFGGPGRPSSTSPMSPRGAMIPGEPPVGAMYQIGGTMFVPVKDSNQNRHSVVGYSPVPPYDSPVANAQAPRATSPHGEVLVPPQYPNTASPMTPQQVTGRYY